MSTNSLKITFSTNLNSFVCIQSNGFKDYYVITIIKFNVIYLHTVKDKNSSIWSINRTQAGFTTLGQSRPGSKGNEEVASYLSKLQNWSLTIRCSLVLYPEHSLRVGASPPPTEMQLVYSIASDNWTVKPSNYDKEDMWGGGHCWWSKDELISNILLWTTTHGHTSVDQPAKTYIRQLLGHWIPSRGFSKCNDQ